MDWIINNAAPVIFFLVILAIVLWPMPNETSPQEREETIRRFKESCNNYGEHQ